MHFNTIKRGHLKFAFIAKNDESKSKKKSKYDIVILLDSGEFKFFKYYEQDGVKRDLSCLNDLIKIFLSYDIDDKSIISYNFTSDKKDTVILSFLSIFRKMNIAKEIFISNENIINSLLINHGKFNGQLKKRKRCTFNYVLNSISNIFDQLISKKICPWISNKNSLSISLLSERDQKIRKFQYVILYIMALKKYTSDYKRNYDLNRHK